MPRPKQMVKRASVEIAARRRKCKFSGAAIPKGAACLVVYDGPRDRFCYSRPVALEMIALARVRLSDLELELDPDESG